MTAQAGSVANPLDFLTSPPVFDLQEPLAASSLSSAARSPVTGVVFFGQGFNGGNAPGISGGFSDGDEVSAGTDPLNAGDFPISIVPAMRWMGRLWMVSGMIAAPLVLGRLRRT